jgi:hypothetical protein
MNRYAARRRQSSSGAFAKYKMHRSKCRSLPVRRGKVLAPEYLNSFFPRDKPGRHVRVGETRSAMRANVYLKNLRVSHSRYGFGIANTCMPAKGDKMTIVTFNV